MARYIDADKLVEKIGNVPLWNGYNEPYSFENHLTLTKIHKLLIDTINAIPTADVEEVKHGKWETTNTTQEGDKVETFFHYHKECKFGYSDNDICGHPYCPECGAKMDG